MNSKLVTTLPAHNACIHAQVSVDGEVPPRGHLHDHDNLELGGNLSWRGEIF